MAFTTHAAERAAERFGLAPSEAEWAQAVLDIIDTVDGVRRAALLLRTFSDGIERWLVHLADCQVVVAYDPVGACIITVHRNERPISTTNLAQRCYGRPVERRQKGRWRFTSDEHIA